MTNDITIIKTSEQRPDDKGVEACLKEESVRDQTKNARELFSGLQNELDEIEDDLKDGLSYLDMKNDTILSYMIDVSNLLLRKVRGEAISEHPSIERTIYYRTILEKIKAIDQRLAYQLNKVITMPDDASEAVQGVNINNLDVDLGSDEDEPNMEERNAHESGRPEDSSENDDDEEDDEDDEDDGSVDSVASESVEDNIGDDSEIEDDVLIAKKDLRNARASGSGKKPVGVYKPPKLRSVAYDDGKEDGGKGRRRRDHNEFYQDDDDNHDIVEETRARRDDERTRYEEENYTRLPDMNPKKAKRKAKQAKLKSKKKFKGAGKRK